jgi:hypothetical protein
MSAPSETKYAVGDKINALIDDGQGDQPTEATIVSVFPSFMYRVRTSAGTESTIYADSISSKVSGGRRRRSRKTRRSRK